MGPICEKSHGLGKKKIAHLWSTQCPSQGWGQCKLNMLPQIRQCLRFMFATWYELWAWEE